jgi:hypothetical protein
VPRQSCLIGFALLSGKNCPVTVLARWLVGWPVSRLINYLNGTHPDMSPTTTFSLAPPEIAPPNPLNNRALNAPTQRDTPPSNASFGQLFERVSAVNNRQKIAAPTPHAEGEAKDTEPNPDGLLAAETTPAVTAEGGDGEKSGPPEALMALVDPMAMSAAAWLVGAGAPQLAGDLQAVPLAGGMQIIAPTQGPDSISVLAFAQAQGMSPQALKLLLGDKAGMQTPSGPQTTAQLLGQIMDARALVAPTAGSTTTPANAPTTQLMAPPMAQPMAPPIAPSITQVGMDTAVLMAQTLVITGVTDEEVQQLLTDGKVGSLEGQGLDRAALAVPRSANPMGIALSQDPTASTASHRSAIYEAIAQRVVDALGARIQGQIAKGQWTMQLTLRPASLGSIDVDLRMHNGELEARFVSANPLTRDLLQDNAQRLKDQLSQAGTDIARVTVDGGSSQQGHGKSTPQRGEAPAQPRGQAVNSGDVSAQAGTVRENSRDDGTLNILV